MEIQGADAPTREEYMMFEMIAALFRSWFGGRPKDACPMCWDIYLCPRCMEQLENDRESEESHDENLQS